MKRRGWFLFQVIGAFVLILSAPRALSGLVEGIEGPYEVHAAPANYAPSEAQATDEGLPSVALESAEPVSSP